MAEPTNFSDLFTEAPSDYALNALEKIFGGIIPYLANQDETYNGVGSFLTTGIGMMNMICLGLAVIVGAYSILSLTADTAADGQILGRSTDTKNTFLRAGLAGILFLPVSGGFALVQLIAFVTAIGGSMLANTTWQWFAEQTLDGTATPGSEALSSDANWQMRGKLGMAAYTMVLGRLCELHMDRLSDTYNVNAHTSRQASSKTITADGAVAPGLGIANTSETKLFEMFYTTGSGANASNDICGSIKYSLTYNLLTAADDDVGASASLNSLTSNLTTVAKNQVYNSVVQALNGSGGMQEKAADLADRIYSGNPQNASANLRDDATVQAELKEMADTAATAILSNRSGLTVSDETAQQIQSQLAAAVTQNGWIVAPLWQRGLAGLYSKIREIQSSLNLDMSIEHRIQSVFGTGAYGFFFSDNDVSRASFAPVERDFEYLANQLPFVMKLAQPDAGSNTSQIGADAGAEMGSQLLRGVYTFFLNKLSPTADDGYVDPFIQYSEVGSGLFPLGAAGLVSGSLVAGITADIPIVGSLVAEVTGPVKTLSYYLLVLAVAFSIVIPMIPILFFFSGVITWFATVIEAVFALPLALLMWLVPAREPSMMGPWNKVVMTLCGLLLRPFFLVVGLITCVLILWVGNEILAIFFRNMLLVLSPDWNIMAALMLCGLLGLYCYVTLMLALNASGAINFLGDAVMNWIGGIVRSPLGESVGQNMGELGRHSTPTPGIGFANPAGKAAISEKGYERGQKMASWARNKLPGRNDMGRLGRG